MSLGIFSFDLAAIIDSLSYLMATGEPENAPVETSLDKTEDVLQNAAGVDSVIDDVLMAAALNSAVTSVISTKAEAVKSPAEIKHAPKPATVALDEETRKEIERLIKSLQTSVIHNYKSSDMIDETVSFNTITNFAQKNRREDGGERESVEQQKKRDEHRLEILRDELKRAILKHNRDV